MIAAIGVQTEVIDNRAASKLFANGVADLIEQNVKALRESGRNPFFAESVNAIYRKDQRH